MARIKIGDLLVQKGLISQEQLEVALAEQKRWGYKLGKTLVTQGFIKEEVLYNVLSEHLRLKRVHLADADISSTVLKILDEKTCRQHSVLPLQIVPHRNTLIMAVSDPTDVVTIDELSFKIGMRIELHLASDKEIGQAIDVWYASDRRRTTGEKSPPATPPPTPPEKLDGVPKRPLKTEDIDIVEQIQQLGQSLERVEEQQRRIMIALKVIAELSINAGLFTKEDYVRRMHQKTS